MKKSCGAFAVREREGLEEGIDASFQEGLPVGCQFFLMQGGGACKAVFLAQQPVFIFAELVEGQQLNLMGAC